MHKDLKADYILANPPFNMSDWGGDRLRDDVRWKFGVPSAGNANFASGATLSSPPRAYWSILPGVSEDDRTWHFSQ